jgi:hypothetical protein
MNFVDHIAGGAELNQSTIELQAIGPLMLRHGLMKQYERLHDARFTRCISSGE